MCPTYTLRALSTNPADSPSTVCSMLKLFLRELDGSLFSEKLHAKFIAAGAYIFPPTDLCHFNINSTLTAL